MRIRRKCMATELLESPNAYRIARALETISIAYKRPLSPTSFQQIAEIVRSGNAKKYFKIGDQVVTKWSPDGVTEYDMPLDVVDFSPVTDPDGVTHENAMWFQSHYSLPAMQYDANEAIYVPAENMPAGTYSFTVGNYWDTYAKAGDIFNFTTTKAVPAGGQLFLGSAQSNVRGYGLASWRIRTFANGLQKTPTEILTLSTGAAGTSLGTVYLNTAYGNNGLNETNRMMHGYCRWSQSAIRQWLNSDKAAEQWWEQKNPFDYRPTQLETMRGFIAGLQQDFLDVVKPIAVKTKLNTATDSAFGEIETTADKFFLPSTNQENIDGGYSAEGNVWEYWANRAGSDDNTVRARYSITDPTIPVPVRLRTARTLDTSCYTAVVSADGVSNVAVFSAYGLAPACVIY